MAIDLKVLYEDNHLIAVYKPAGLLVQGDKTGDVCLMDIVKDFLKEKYDKKGNVFLGLIHRLDRPVAGIVLFAKTSKGASRLSKQFREHEISKIYTARVEGILEHKKGELKNYLFKDEGEGKAIIREANDGSNVQIAELVYEVLKEEKDFSLVRIVLGTGRFHQIRAQFSNIGHPIVGDIKYGAKKSFPDGHIELCATELSFKKAVGEEIEKISIEYPYL